MLERNRLIQQCSVNTNPDCLSPELHDNKNTIIKCQSSTNITNMITSAYNLDQQSDNINGQTKNHTLTKSVSGSNIACSNGQNKAEGTNEQSTSSASGISSPSNNSQKDEEEKQCIFCHQSESTIFSVSNSMNSHYWRACPMLVRCRACSQVVEVAALSEHLLMECEHREQYTQCSQCTEAVKLEEYAHHSDNCSELLEGCNRCPLCHENIEDEDNVWKVHLMGDKACSKNTRIRSTSKQVTIKL